MGLVQLGGGKNPPKTNNTCNLERSNLSWNEQHFRTRKRMFFGYDSFPFCDGINDSGGVWLLVFREFFRGWKKDPFLFENGPFLYGDILEIFWGRRSEMIWLCGGGLLIPGPDSVQKMGPMFIGQSFNRTLVRWPGRFSCGNKNGGLGLGFCGAKISGGPLDLVTIVVFSRWVIWDAGGFFFCWTCLGEWHQTLSMVHIYIYLQSYLPLAWLLTTVFFRSTLQNLERRFN